MYFLYLLSYLGEKNIKNSFDILQDIVPGIEQL